MMLRRQKNWSSRLELAGGAQALVERVIAVVEYGLSAYKFDIDSSDTRLLKSVKPELSLLIDITEEVADSMQSRSDHYDRAREQASVAIVDCNDAERRVAGLGASDSEPKRLINDLRMADSSIEFDLLKVQTTLQRLAAFWWVPGYNWYLLGKDMDDIEDTWSAEWTRLSAHSGDSSKPDVFCLNTFLKWHSTMTARRVTTLEKTMTRFEQSSKLYAAKVATLSNAAVFYRRLRKAIEVMEDDVDLSRTIERLYESRDLILITEEEEEKVRRESLKEILIQLGGDYDRFLEDEGMVKPVNISFKLFNIHDTMDPAYRKVTVQEATIHRDALFKAMPSWEVANLADGSVDGRLCGGRVSREFRSSVGHVLGTLKR